MATAVDNTQEAINYLVLRWKKDDSASRAKMLRWLQDAEDIIWNTEDWWFSRDEEALSWTTGNATYSSPSGTTKVLHVVDATGASLDRIPYPTFLSLYRSSSATGTPSVWTVDQRNTSTGVLTLRFWPTPSGNSSATLTRKIAQADLSDSGSSVSNIPREYRNAHLYHALHLMALDEGQGQEAEIWKARFNEIIVAMQRENASQLGLVPMQ